MEKCRYIMTDSVVTCRPENSLADAGRLMREKNCGALPVVDSAEKIVGILTDRDICLSLTASNRPAGELLVSDVMSRQVSTCLVEDSICDALEVMRAAKVRRVPVVDQDNRLRGIITVNDILIRSDEVSGVSCTLKTICEDIASVQTDHASFNQRV